MTTHTFTPATPLLPTDPSGGPRPLRPPHRTLAQALLLAGLLAGGCAPAGNAESPPAERAEEAGHSDEEEHAHDEEHSDEEAHSDEVELDSAAVAAAGIVLVAVDTVSTLDLRVTGTITYDADRVVRIGPRVEGRLASLPVEAGASVGAGRTLAILESAEVGALRADREEAETLVAIAREHFEREERLHDRGISSRRELLEAEAELRRSEAALRRATRQLEALGAEVGSGVEVHLSSPFSGTVVSREGAPGQVVSPTDVVLVVADLAHLWIELDLYERDLGRVEGGERVQVTTASLPGRVFPGTIAYVADVVDPSTRTVRARVEVPNSDRSLKPGMFAAATIEVKGEGAGRLVVPAEAIQEVEGRSVVFVPGGEPGHFVARPVEVGRDDGSAVEILAGVSAGDLVVAAGAFTLRSELARAEIGEAGHAH